MIGPPTATAAGAVFVSTRSAEGGLTTVDSVAELFSRLGSAVEEVAVAVFERSTSVVGVTLTTMVAEAPEATVPSEHVTVVVPEHGPGSPPPTRR